MSASYHPSDDEFRTNASGQIYEHYKNLKMPDGKPAIPWLHKEEGNAGSKGNMWPWKPISDGWTSQDTEALWKPWGKLLSCFADPSVEEIFIQRIHGTTPNGYLDVMTDGLLGKRVHLQLRMPEGDLITGYTTIMAKISLQLFSQATPKGKATIASALEPDGTRLTGGVSPASIAPFACIRIPARERPTIMHLVGAHKFGEGLDVALCLPGEPLKIPDYDPIKLAKDALADGGVKGSVMLPVEALEYLRATATVGWNPVYSGATSSAKTTTLNAAIALLPLHWRVVTVETGVAELKIPHVDWVPLFTSDKVDGLDQESLVKLAMRMSPKPIPNGEIRGKEGALWQELTTTGHEASPTTLHAGNADECLMRLTNMIMAGTNGLLTEATARIKAAMAANVVVQLAREEVLDKGVVKSVRRCREIYEVQVTGSYIAGTQKIKVVKIFETRTAEDGSATLTYIPGRSHLWYKMRAKYKDKEIPAWAQSEGKTIPEGLED